MQRRYTSIGLDRIGHLWETKFLVGMEEGRIYCVRKLASIQQRIKPEATLSCKVRSGNFAIPTKEIQNSRKRSTLQRERARSARSKDKEGEGTGKKVAGKEERKRRKKCSFTEIHHKLMSPYPNLYNLHRSVLPPNSYAPSKSTCTNKTT